MATAFALVARGVADEIILVSRDPGGRATGEAEDLAHASMFLNPNPVTIRPGVLSDTAGSDVVVVTSSIRPTPQVRTRADLAEPNVAIIRQIMPQLVRHNPAAVFIIVTNPVDVMTHLAMRYGNLPPGRVIGTGTLIDTGRFRALLAELMGIYAHDVRAYVFGEHGETMVPALSQATVGGVKLPESDATILERFQQARDAGMEVFRKKGYTDYAIAGCAVMIVNAIAEDTHEVLPVSTLVEGQYGISGVSLSLPCVVGRQGIVRVLEPDLSDQEIAALRASAEAVRQVLDRVAPA